MLKASTIVNVHTKAAALFDGFSFFGFFET